MNLYLMEDAVRNIESNSCGVFGLFFYNLLGLRNNGKILNRQNLPKNTVQTLLNEIFLLDQDHDENILENYIKENNINFHWGEIMYY